MVERVVMVALVITVIFGGVQIFERSTREALQCQGSAVAQLAIDGTTRCVQAAAAPLAVNTPSSSATAPGNVCSGPGCTDDGMGSPPGGAPASDGCRGGICTMPGQCFVAGTPVLTANGTRAIEELQPGDLVVSADATNPTSSVQRVLRTFVRPDARLVALRVVGQDGTPDTLQVTPEHPFWAPGRGWIAAGALDRGAALMNALGQEATVVDVAPLAATATVYNIEVENTHTYFAGALALWVHNVCDAVNWPGTVPALQSDSGAYVIPTYPNNYMPTPENPPLIYVAGGGAAEPPVATEPQPGGAPVDFGSTTYFPYQACSRYMADCLETTEQIINGNHPIKPGKLNSIVVATGKPFGAGTDQNIAAAQAVPPDQANHNAIPEVGQGYVIVNPHWPDTSQTTTSYHAEAVVAADGPDRITHWVTAPETEEGEEVDPGRNTFGLFSIYPTDPGDTAFYTFHGNNTLPPPPGSLPPFDDQAITIVIGPKPPKKGSRPRPTKQDKPSKPNHGGPDRPSRPDHSAHPYPRPTAGGSSTRPRSIRFLGGQ